MLATILMRNANLLTHLARSQLPAFFSLGVRSLALLKSLHRQCPITASNLTAGTLLGAVEWGE